MKKPEDSFAQVIVEHHNTKGCNDLGFELEETEKETYIDDEIVPESPVRTRVE